MVRAAHQSLATGIVIQIIELLLPKPFSLKCFRMATRLPETALLCAQIGDGGAWFGPG